MAPKEKPLQNTIHAKGTEISVISFTDDKEDYLSLTDLARYRNQELPGYVIQNWMRLRSTIEFLGLWEQLNNPSFNCVEFDAIGRRPPGRCGLK